MSETIHIMALKHPNIPHYEWEGEIIKKTDDYIVVLCKPGRQLKHHTKGKTFTMKNTSIELFSFKEWYTVAAGVEEGEITSYYCNVAMPSKMNGNELTFVDLDLDLVKKVNADWQVVDEDEFEENSLKFSYSNELKDYAIHSLEELKKKALHKQFPFDESILNMLNK
ncbi:MAG TPA: DUF402 domain-containing protein [Bacillaceae bacterium]|nr:DUF402 domain-containing protein [Paenibacillus bovis]HLU21427.1 DUF402 domain-containing protein [Bacillaceae bacterium]